MTFIIILELEIKLKVSNEPVLAKYRVQRKIITPTEGICIWFIYDA